MGKCPNCGSEELGNLSGKCYSCGSKPCEICKTPHQRVGHRTCGAQACLSDLLKRKKRNAAARARHDVYTSLGMVRNRNGSYE